MFAPRATASILHADLDAFSASVHQRDDPSLRGKPVIVGGGVVMAASYEARAFGVHAAMGGSQARRLCPDAIVVEPNLAGYTAASRDVFAIFADTTPLVEPLSVDEAFLDVAGLAKIAGSPVAIARRLRDRVRAEVGLPITVGVARTKFLAKVASDLGKPNGLLEVPPEEEIEFLHPLAVERLWGVGAVTKAKLNQRGIDTVADLAAVPFPALTAIVGPASAHHLHALAHLNDPRPVETGRRRRSVGSQHALGRAHRTGAELDTLLVGIVDRVTRRLRKAGRVGRTVTLRMRFDDFARATRAHTLDAASDRTEEFLATARWLLAAEAALIAERGLTLIGLSISNLDDDEAIQLSLPFPSEGAAGADRDLDHALDGVRAKFGSDAVTRAVLLGRNLEAQVPILPD